MRRVRVRFAPSPTGPLHIGGVRTALYNYLFAKKMGGDMILRIEDTDQTRFVPGAEAYIIEALTWLGIKFDEGVHIGGPHEPYRQSDRKPMYRKYAEQLVNDGWAYYAFDTAEELDKRRKDAEAQKRTFQYDASTRGEMRNSLTLPEAEVKELLANGSQYVIRFKFPQDEEIEVNDLIRGRVTVNSNLLDDKVLFKSDGMPTYHLANIVDDYEMEVTHVIRGEEWLPSAPLHVMLYKAFGWEAVMPEFAHLPLLLKPDGNGKLGKRDGDRLGFPVFPLLWKDPFTGNISSGYRESGYLPEAVVNFLALLGWNPGIDKEIFSMDELVELFSLERISKSGAKFDLKKAHWFNHEYILNADKKTLLEVFKKDLAQRDVAASDEYICQVLDAIKDRVNLLSELWSVSAYFFVAPSEYDATALKKRWKDDTGALLASAAEELNKIERFEDNLAHDILVEFAQNKGVGLGNLMNPLRISLVGTTSGPDLGLLMNILGKTEVLARINRLIEHQK